MLPTSRNSSHFIQICVRSRAHFIQCTHKQLFQFSTSSKKEREAKLATKYKANTKLPKRIGQHANTNIDELVYFPKVDQQLNPQLYASHLSDNASNGKVCIYNYKKRFIDVNRSEIKETLQFALFTCLALGFPAMLMYTLYKGPKYNLGWTGNLTHEGVFYWTQSILMAFLIGGFFVALRHQSASWIKMLKIKIYGSTSYISSISIMQPNILNVDYFHNTLFDKKQLTHNIPLSATEINKYFYLKPAINAITNSADIEVVMDLPDKKGNVLPITMPMDGTVLNWESFITFFKDIPNAAGKFKAVQVDKDGFIPVCKYKDLLQCPRTTLNLYSHGIPPYKKKNTYLFVPNIKKDELFVVYDHCKSRNESLIHKAAFYEEKGQTYLHCNSCHQSRNKMIKPLRSCVEWKLDGENEEEAVLLIKLDSSVIKNPLEFTDAFNHCPLETFIGFYCTNSFRLSHPNTLQDINDVFVLGELTQFPDWKDEHSPSITSLQST